MNRFFPILTILVLLASFLPAGCGGLPPRPGLSSPDFNTSRMVGLVLSEKVMVNFKRDAGMGATPLRDAVSRYRAELEPGGLDVVFESRGAGGIYLAWVDAGRLPEDLSEVRVILTGHVIERLVNIVSTEWPPDKAPALSGPIAPGRVTYLGMVVRNIKLRPSVDDRAEPPVVKISVESDPEGRGIAGAVRENPWLGEMLLNPPRE